MKKKNTKAEIRTALQALLDTEYIEDGKKTTGAEQIAYALFSQAKDPNSPYWSKAIDLVLKYTDTSPKEQLELDMMKCQLTKATAPASGLDLLCDRDDFAETTKEGIRHRLDTI